MTNTSTNALLLTVRGQLRGVSGPAEHINESFPDEFPERDWLSFSNPDAVQYGSDVTERQTISAESSDENGGTNENDAH